ncbi:MAG: prepilin-type N-terminal cleavage/methylation domain-containing protein [Nitrospirae bacterium]|nr:prepilin-type N-terminal cleavage/methylation domain-containing protein [Nitrospirota bacterium]
MSRTHPKPLKRQQGATLVELLVALLIAGLVFAGVYQIYINSIRTTTVQEQVADMQQTARVVMNQIMRELRLAGYNPNQPMGVEGFQGLVTNPLDLSSGQAFILVGDFVPDNATVPDTVTYRIDKTDPAHPWLTRKLNNDPAVNFGANIDNLVVTFYNAGNCRLGDVACAGLDAKDVRRVTVELTARTDRSDKDFKDPVAMDGYRRRRLSSDAILRNMGGPTDSTPPLCPTNVTASITGGCRIVRVTWTRPNDIGGDLAGYYIYYDQAPINTNTSAFVNITDDPNVTNYSYDLAVSSAGTWNIGVSSYDSSGNLCDNNAANGYPPADPVIPSGSPVIIGSPTSIPSPPPSPVADPDVNQVTVQWGQVLTYTDGTSPVAGLAGYRLYRATLPDMSDQVMIANEFALPISEIVGGGTDHTIQYVDNDSNTIVAGSPSPPLNCQIYYYQVTVVDQCSVESARSTAQSAKPDGTFTPGVTPPDNGRAPAPPVITYLEAGDDTSTVILGWAVPAPSASQSTPVGVRIYYRVEGAIPWTLWVDLPIAPPLPASGTQIITGLSTNTNYEIKVAAYDDVATACGDEAGSTIGDVFTGACAPRLEPAKQAHRIYPGTAIAGVPVATDSSAVVGLLSPSADQYITWVVDPEDCTPDSSTFGDEGFDYNDPPGYTTVASTSTGSAHVQFYINDPGFPDNKADTRYGTAATGNNPGNVFRATNDTNIDYAPRGGDDFYHFPSDPLNPLHLDTALFCDASYDFKVIGVDGEQYTASATTQLAIKNGGIEVDAAKGVTSDITTTDDFHHIVRFGIKNTNPVKDMKLNKITLTWKNLNAELEKLEVLKADKTTVLGKWDSSGGTPSGRVGTGTVLTLNPVPTLMKADGSGTADEGYIRLTFKNTVGTITSSADMRAQNSATDEVITILNLDQQDAAALGSDGICSTTTAGAVTVPRDPTLSAADTVQNQPAAFTALSQTRSDIIVPTGATVTVTTKTTPGQPGLMKLYYMVDNQVLVSGPDRPAAAGGGGNYPSSVTGVFDNIQNVWNFVMPSNPDQLIWFYLEAMNGSVGSPEIIGDGVGNENGVCEDGEACETTDPFSRNFDIHPDSGVFTYVQCGTSLPVVSITKPSANSGVGDQIVNATVTTTIPLDEVVLTVTDDASAQGVPDSTGDKTMCFGTDSCSGTQNGSSQGWTTTYGADCSNGLIAGCPRTNVKHSIKVTARDVCGQTGFATKNLN